jgi:hypothetical protein
MALAPRQPALVEVEDAARRIAEQPGEDLAPLRREVGLAGSEQDVGRQVDHAHGLIADPDPHAEPGPLERRLLALDGPQDDEEDHDLGQEIDVDERPQESRPARPHLDDPPGPHACTSTTALFWTSTSSEWEKMS